MIAARVVRVGRLLAIRQQKLDVARAALGVAEQKVKDAEEERIARERAWAESADGAFAQREIVAADLADRLHAVQQLSRAAAAAASRVRSASVRRDEKARATAAEFIERRKMDRLAEILRDEINAVERRADQLLTDELATRRKA